MVMGGRVLKKKCNADRRNKVKKCLKALGSLLAKSGEKEFFQFLFAILSNGFIGYSPEFNLNMLMLHYIRQDSAAPK